MDMNKAQAEDVMAVATLWHAGWHQAHASIVQPALVQSRVLAEFVTRTKAHLESTHVARVEGRFAGFYMIENEEIYQFYVDAAFQGQGLATKLMASAEEALDGRLAWLACSVGNDRAARFYEKSGWQRETEEDYTVETAEGSQVVTIWRYEKDLR